MEAQYVPHHYDIGGAPPQVLQWRENTPLNRTIAEMGNSTIGTTQEAIESGNHYSC